MTRQRDSRQTRGLRITACIPRSPAWTAGIRRGDVITGVDSETVAHEVDFRFLTASPHCTVRFLRRGRLRETALFRRAGQVPGLSFAAQPIRRCPNRCIFCFIDQLPPHLRKSLYIKDEDCNHSFFNGNYVTLTGVTRPDIRRIARFGMSPLYVSVHAIQPDVRRAMLRNRHAGDVREKLGMLARNGIQFHAQIVVCPGINDGSVLRKTIAGLCRYRTAMLSCAVVPVGLTRFHRNGLMPVTPDGAAAVLDDVERLSDSDRRSTGVRRVFASDEFYLAAGRPVRPHSYYGQFPQLGNGVGLVRRLLDERDRLRRRSPHADPHRRARGGRGAPAARNGGVCVVTSVAAYPFIKRCAGLCAGLCDGQCDGRRPEPGSGVRVVAVPNAFFGETVTVAGLLTARDVMRAIRALRPRPSLAVIPSVMLNYRGYTLDGLSVNRMRKRLGIAVAAAADLTEMMSIIDSDVRRTSR